jgi:DNA helicase HerA-like ATPase
MNEGERKDRYVGTLIGESTSREFRLALAQDTVREQDLIAVDAEQRGSPQQEVGERLRIWAKVQRIERLNPLFPAEAGHELAATHTDPFDTVLSLSREMVTAVCQVLGVERAEGAAGGKLDQLRYPPRPASSAYRPAAGDIARIVQGDLAQKSRRALDLATLANRPEVDVAVDGHAIVTRHLAILAMTGAGKSWTARRLIEQLAARRYPMIIFDPHGDYTGLADVPQLTERVRLYHAELPIFEEAADDATRIIAGLSGEEMSAPQADAFDTMFSAVRRMGSDGGQLGPLADALYDITRNNDIRTFGVRRDLSLLAHIAEALAIVIRDRDATAQRSRLSEFGLGSAVKVDARLADTFRVLRRQLRGAAFSLHEMEKINRLRAGRAQALPAERRELVRPGQIAVISLAGYSDTVQATLYAVLARHLFAQRVQGRLRYPYLMVLEEAHTFVPGQAATPALQSSIAVTKQIAQEGRKFNVGLVLISQRPSRLDETTLSQCNSYIIMRMVNPADQVFVRRVVETLGEEEAGLLPGLDVGEALLSGQLIGFPVLVKIKEPLSKGEREEDDAFDVLAQAEMQR